jgi:enamine deaminase RidA (YjgF/YER057c/UK114 family)
VSILKLLVTGGWDPDTFVIPRDLSTQISQAFKNVELNLKNAGAQGWSEVYKIVRYHAPLNNEAVELVVENMRKYCPHHQPCWTAVGVQQLRGDDMRAEIDVMAHSPK